MFTKIVCPVGCDEDSFFAVPASIELARKFGARLILLHLDDTFLDKEERMMLRVSVREAKEEFTRKAIEDRRCIEDIIKKNGWTSAISEIVIREGSPGYHLPEVATDLNADLIVIHTTGRQQLYEKVIGSTADSIIHHATMPVLVLRNNRK